MSALVSKVGSSRSCKRKGNIQQMLQQQSIMAGFSIWTTLSWDLHNSVKGHKEQMCK